MDRKITQTRICRLSKRTIRPFQQPAQAQLVATEKTHEILLNIQKKGTLNFVQECVKALAPQRIRVLPDIFMHNLARLFRQAHKVDDEIGWTSVKGRKHQVKAEEERRLKVTDWVLQDIDQVLTEELSEQGLRRDRTYKECCKTVKPDFTISVRDLENPARVVEYRAPSFSA